MTELSTIAVMFIASNGYLNTLAGDNMKVPKHKREQDAQSFAHKSSLYQEFLAEREEILRHKWLESEKHGHDVGFERALLDWIRNHRDQWRQSRRSPDATQEAK